MGVLTNVRDWRSDDGDLLVRVDVKARTVPAFVIRAAAMGQALKTAGLIPSDFIGSIKDPLERADEDTLRRVTIEREEYEREREGFRPTRVTGTVVVRVKNSRRAEDAASLMESERFDFLEDPT